MSSSFEPANLLEMALKKATDDPASRPRFFGELLDSKVLIVPAGEKPRIVNGVVPENSKIAIANIEFGGRSCIPFFTSEARLPTGTEYLALEARVLFQMTRGAYLIMNPGTGYGKEFFPDEVSRKAKRRHVLILDKLYWQPFLLSFIKSQDATTFALSTIRRIARGSD